MYRVNTLLVGSSGVVASAVSPELISTVANDVPNVIQILVQIVIGIATLINLFKRKKTV